MKIYIATDHAGYDHKEIVKKFLIEAGHEVVDHGAFEKQDGDDYPDFVKPCAEAVAKDSESKGVILGGSGQGEAMCANRTPGVRAVVYYGGNTDILKLSREHNDANVLSIGARFVPIEDLEEIVQTWLEASFSEDERHIRRLSKF